MNFRSPTMKKLVSAAATVVLLPFWQTQTTLAASQAKHTLHKSNAAHGPAAPIIPVAGEIGAETIKAIVPVEAWRKSAPTVPAPRPFQLPKVESYKLENGLTVEFVEDHRFPFLSFSLGFRHGSAQEPSDLVGVAGMTADLLTEGTTSKKSKEIASAVDFIGGALGASSDYDYTLFSGSALSNYTERLMSIMSDCLLNPTFPEDELTLNKTNMIQELTLKRSDPTFLMRERFNKVVFGSHPYSIVSPSEASINRIGQKDLIAYHKQNYVPNDAVLIVIGDFSPDKMKDLIGKYFGDVWKPGHLEVASLPVPPTQTGRKIYLVDRPGSVQTTLTLGNVGVQRNDPNYFPLIVTNQILGGASNSRLFQNIREQKGYTYGAYSRLSARKDRGYFSAGADVRTEVTGPSLQEFLYELERIRNLKVTDKELNSAKNYLAGSFQLGLETQGGLAQRLLEAKLFDLPADYLETYADKVMAVNIDDVRASARRLIDTDNLVITAVGDAKKIKQDLELFAPVTVYDTQGKLSSGEASESNPDNKPKSIN